MEAPGFWDDADKSQEAMKELKSLKDSFEKYNELKQGMDDIETLIARKCWMSSRHSLTVSA